MATATPIENQERRWELEETAAGFRGRRHYRVDTAALDAALLASGLPRLGDAWSASLPALVVTRRGPVEVWASKPDGPADHGWAYVPVEYETPASGGLGTIEPPPAPALRHTVYSRAEQAITVTKGLVPNANDPAPAAIPGAAQVGTTLLADDGTLLIGDGEGAPKVLYQSTATVHCWRAANNPFNDQPLVEAGADPCVNQADVVLPPIYGSTQTRACAKGTLRFAGYDLSFENNLWHLQVSLVVAVNHYHYWAAVNTNGLPAGEKVYASKIYRNADFSGILQT